MHWALRMDAEEGDKEEICKFDKIIENVEDSFGFNVYAFVENALDVKEDTKIIVEDNAPTVEIILHIEEDTKTIFDDIEVDEEEILKIF